MCMILSSSCYSRLVKILTVIDLFFFDLSRKYIAIRYTATRAWRRVRVGRLCESRRARVGVRFYRDYNLFDCLVKVSKLGCVEWKRKEREKRKQSLVMISRSSVFRMVQKGRT